MQRERISSAEGEDYQCRGRGLAVQRERVSSAEGEG